MVVKPERRAEPVPAGCSLPLPCGAKSALLMAWRRSQRGLLPRPVRVAKYPRLAASTSSSVIPHCATRKRTMSALPAAASHPTVPTALAAWMSHLRVRASLSLHSGRSAAMTTSRRRPTSTTGQCITRWEMAKSGARPPRSKTSAEAMPVARRADSAVRSSFGAALQGKQDRPFQSLRQQVRTQDLRENAQRAGIAEATCLAADSNAFTSSSAACAAFIFSAEASVAVGCCSPLPAAAAAVAAARAPPCAAAPVASGRRRCGCRRRE